MKEIDKKIKDKFYDEHYVITSPYYKKTSDLNILVVSDMHYHENVDKQIFKMLACHVFMAKPDVVIMPGDLIETNAFLNSKHEREFFEFILKEIANVASIIITPGNHEIANFDKKLDRSEARETLKYFDSLNKYNNIYFLNNESMKLKGTSFFGFNPRLDYYFKYNKEEGTEMILEDYLKSGLHMNSNDYNILISHITPSCYDDKLKTDLTISGHWHDGYMPKKIDKFFGETNAGLFLTPFVKPYPGILCRGVHEFGRGYILISQGFRKWTADIGLFNAFEKITANDVESVTIKNDDNFGKSYTRVR